MDAQKIMFLLQTNIASEFQPTQKNLIKQSKNVILKEVSFYNIQVMKFIKVYHLRSKNWKKLYLDLEMWTNIGLEQISELLDGIGEIFFINCFLKKNFEIFFCFVFLGRLVDKVLQNIWNGKVEKKILVVLLQNVLMKMVLLQWHFMNPLLM